MKSIIFNILGIILAALFLYSLYVVCIFSSLTLKEGSELPIIYKIIFFLLFLFDISILLYLIYKLVKNIKQL